MAEQEPRLKTGVFQRPPTPILLQKYRDRNGSRIVIQIGGVYAISLAIGNGVGKQGGGNQPPYRRYGPNTEIQHRPREPHGLTKTTRILSKREADTEFQYRPHIVDTETDCGRHFCGRHFRDSYFSARRRTYFLQKYRDRTGRCIAILFRSIGVRGSI